jgi:hypothetical protein
MKIQSLKNTTLILESRIASIQKHNEIMGYSKINDDKIEIVEEKTIYNKTIMV